MSLPHLHQTPPPPSNEDEFDNMARDVLSERLGVQHLTRLGRRGQKQDGIDGFSSGDANSVVWQATLQKRGQLAKLRADLEMMDDDWIGSPSDFYFVVGTERDASLQRAVLELSSLRSATGKCGVHVLFWDEMWRTILTTDNLRSIHAPWAVGSGGLGDSPPLDERYTSVDSDTEHLRWCTYLLGRLSDELASASTARTDLSLGVPPAYVTELNPSEFPSMLRSKLGMLQRWTATVDPLLNEHLSSILEEDGGKFAPARLDYVAETIGRVYRGIVDWGLEWRGVTLRGDWDEVLHTLSLVAETLATQIEHFRDRLAVAIAAATNHDGLEPASFSVTLKFDLPPLDDLFDHVDDLVRSDLAAD